MVTLNTSERERNREWERERNGNEREGGHATTFGSFFVGATRLFDNALTDGEGATLADDGARCVNGDSYFSVMHPVMNDGIVHAAT